MSNAETLRLGAKAKKIAQAIKQKADQDSAQKISTAREESLAQIATEQVKAKEAINNTLFDSLYMISCGNLQKVDPAGVATPLSTSSPSFTLPEKTLTFTGNGNVIWSNSVSLGNFTLEAWVLPDELPNITSTSDVFRGLLGGGKRFDASNRSACIYIHNNFGIHFGFGTGTEWCSFRVEDVLIPKQWNHVATTFDSTNYNLYVNGQLKFTSAIYAGKQPIDSADCGINILGVLDNNYSGQVFEVRAWHLARTQEQIVDTLYSTLNPAEEEGLWFYIPLRSETENPYQNLYQPTQPPGVATNATWETPHVSQYPKPTKLPYAADLTIVVDASQFDQSYLVFCSLASPFTIMQCDLDGKNTQTIYTATQPISSVAVDESTKSVYWIEGTGVIKSCQPNGSNVQEICDISTAGKKSFWQLDVDSINSKVYWTNDSAIWRVNMDGSEAEIFISCCHAPYPIDIAVDENNGFLYWIDQENKSIGQASLSDGMSSAKNLYSVNCPNRGIDVDYSKGIIYWSESDDQQNHYLMRGQTDGSSQPPSKVFPIPCEGGLAVISQSQPAYLARANAIKTRDQNQVTADKQIDDATTTSQTNVANARTQLAQDHDTAHNTIVEAQNTATTQRAAQKEQLAIATQASIDRVAQAKTANNQKLTKANQDADYIRQKAQNDSNIRITNAKNNLTAAKKERAKY